MKKHGIVTVLALLAAILSCSAAGLTAPPTPVPGVTPSPSPPALVTLMAVGDLNFHNIDGRVIANPDYPWAGTKEVLKTATILMGNQEVPFSDRGAIYAEKQWTLRANPKSVAGLVAAGFDVVTLANNHMMDYGPLALEDTLFTLKKAGIAYTGAGMNRAEARQPAFLTAPNGKRFAFLAYSLTFPEVFWATANRPGTAHGNPAHFPDDIGKAKEQADFVIVSFHWGKELQFYPSDYQKNYGKRSIDAGADLVIGHHPHVLQGLEVYKGKLIAYSLGNFLFGSYSKNCTDSVILGVDFDSEGPLNARLHPVNVNNHQVHFQTKLRRGADAERVLQDLRTYSKGFGTVIETQGDLGVIRIRKQ
jgi:poly-gamma-glutamate capsule biosynthesis protein CapA/YwtB (metallophosphatase superfamily)